MATRWRFDGEIAAFGTTTGHRVVIGHWPTSPFGPVSDVMLEAPDSTRVLIAPSAEVARFITDTYCFDAVQVEPVSVIRRPGELILVTGQLQVRLVIGRRGRLGLLLRAVPRRVARAPVWAALLDPLVRIVLPGVRTRGSAGAGRREWYGAWDLHRLVSVTARWRGADLGAMADVSPPVRFGFGSAPRQPSIVRLTTTVQFRTHCQEKLVNTLCRTGQTAGHPARQADPVKRTRIGRRDFRARQALPTAEEARNPVASRRDRRK